MPKKVLKSAMECLMAQKERDCEKGKERYDNIEQWGAPENVAYGYAADCLRLAQYQAILGFKNKAEKYFSIASDAILVRYNMEISHEKYINPVPYLWMIAIASLLSNDLQKAKHHLKIVSDYDYPTYKDVGDYRVNYIKCVAGLAINQTLDQDILNKFKRTEQKYLKRFKFPKISYVFEGIITKDKSLIADGLNSIFKQYGYQYPRNEKIPFCKWGNALMQLCKICNITIDPQIDIDEKNRMFIPPIYGGDSILDESPPPDENNLKKNEIIIEPLYGKDTHAFMPILEHDHKHYWKNQGPYINFKVSDDSYFTTNRIKTGILNEFEIFTTYKIIIKFKKKGYYIVLQQKPIGMKNDVFYEMHNTAIFISVSKGVAKVLFKITQKPDEDDEHFKEMIKYIDPTSGPTYSLME